MFPRPQLFRPSAGFWTEVARAILGNRTICPSTGPDLSALRVVVPDAMHAHLLKMALAAECGGGLLPPRIGTLAAWIAQLPLSHAAPVFGDSQRVLTMYAELRQHAWLKKLFAARRNTDLLPLAETLLKLADELTQSLLPSLKLEPDAVAKRWQSAMDQLFGPTRQTLSDEAQLVWAIWKGQLDSNDPNAARFESMLRLAARADEPLVWISAREPEGFEQAFLTAYSARQPVWRFLLDWRTPAIPPLLAQAWPELAATETDHVDADPAVDRPLGLTLCKSSSLEQEAQQGAQTVIDWVRQGKSNIAIVVQDRVVARRTRALLERAGVLASDKTGWKLSTTRAAAALAAWFEVIASRADTHALLDLLKSPFLFANLDDKPAQVAAVEFALRKSNVLGGWDAVTTALSGFPAAQESVLLLERQARLFAERKKLSEWITLTYGALGAFGMYAALEADEAGRQVITMLDRIDQDCESVTHQFSWDPLESTCRHASLSIL